MSENTTSGTIWLGLNAGLKAAAKASPGMLKKQKATKINILMCMVFIVMFFITF